MDPTTVDPTALLSQINKGMSAPMSQMTGGSTPQAPQFSPQATGGGQMLPGASPGGGVSPAGGQTPQSNDMRNQIAAAMQAQQLQAQNQAGYAATRANPTGIDPLAAAQMPFTPGVSGQPQQQTPIPQAYYG
jgi:hypothetical protein